MRIQYLWAHPTNSSLGGAKGFGHNIGAQVSHCYQPKIHNTGDGSVINEIDKNVCLFSLSAREKSDQGLWIYPFQIAVNNTQPVQVGHTRHYLGKLQTMDQQVNDRRKVPNIATSCKRLASGLDFVYCVRFPFGIHAVRISKQFDLTITPNRGRMFRWFKCLHTMISRHNFWETLREERAWSRLDVP